MSQRIASFAMIIGLALTVSACNSLGSTPSGNTSMEKSLYDRLGGKTAIAAVVDDFVGRVARGYSHQREVRQCQHPAPEIDAGRSDLPGLRRSLHLHRPRHEEYARRHGREQQRFRCAGRRPGGDTQQVQGAGTGEERVAGRARPDEGGYRRETDGFDAVADCSEPGRAALAVASPCPTLTSDTRQPEQMRNFDILSVPSCGPALGHCRFSIHATFFSCGPSPPSSVVQMDKRRKCLHGRVDPITFRHAAIRWRGKL